MSNKDHYKNLLLKEERLSLEITLSKANIEQSIKDSLNPQNLFNFYESKIEKHIVHDSSEGFELKTYLISMTLDFLYEKVSESLFSKSKDKNKTVDWRGIAKPIVDSFYIKNRAYVTNLVSKYMDKGVKKWTNK